MASSSKKSQTQTSGVTSAADWKGRKSVAGVELSLPSGNVCLVKPVSIAEMISENMLPDSLLPIVSGHIDKGKGRPPADFKKKSDKERDKGVDKVLQDPKKLAEMFDSVDRLVPRIVLQPELRYHKEEIDPGTGISQWQDIPANERDQNVLYTDEVDINDKFFIFQWVAGGTSDLESFREEYSAPLDGVRAG